MKTLLTLLAAVCLAMPALAEPALNKQGTKPATSLEAQLIALESSTWEAVKKQDVKAFADVCLPDCIEIWGDGTVLTIKEVLAQVPDTVLSEYKLEDFKISFPAENTALVRYRAWVRAAYKGEALPPRWMLSSAVWVKKSGAWKAAFYQETPEPTPMPAATANVEKELIQLEHDWAKAYLTRDVKTLERLEADDWECTNAGGKISSKAKDLVDVGSGSYTATEFAMSDLKVRLYGDTAIVTGRQKEISTHDGKDTSALYQFTDTWFLRDSQWRCIATHLSKVVPKTDEAAIKQAVGQKMDALIEAFEKTDVEAVLAFYLDDPAFLIADEKGRLKDSAAYRKGMREYFQNVSAEKIHTRKQECRILDNDTVIVAWQGSYECQKKNGPLLTTDAFAATFVFKRIGGDWKIVYSHESGMPAKPVASDTKAVP